MTKSIKFTSKNDRIERVEAAMVKIGLAVNDNIVRLAGDIAKANEALELIYDELMARTPQGLFKALVKWVGGKE